MKSFLSFSNVIPILYAIICLFMIQRLVECKEFCSDTQEVSHIFTMNDITYIGKGDVFYAKTSTEKFAGKTSVDPNDIFQTGMKSSDFNVLSLKKLTIHSKQTLRVLVPVSSCQPFLHVVDRMSTKK